VTVGDRSIEGVDATTKFAVISFQLKPDVQPPGDCGRVLPEKVGDVAGPKPVPCQSQSRELDPSLEDSGGSQARPQYVKIMSTCREETIGKLITTQQCGTWHRFASPGRAAK
jgi:hypothetical protein